MSFSWRQRKERLAALVLSRGDEDADGATVDRLMHGQNAIGKTAKTSEIDSLRFKDHDLQAIGPLEYGQFGVIEIVTCKLDSRVYVRKSIEKQFAMRTREQCSPQTERNILLSASLTDTPWAPHLLAAFQMSTHLHLVMDYAEGGNLWDVLESSPHGGKILESDLKWWAPQAASAIYWCHTQGYAHRDIKPHNFVITKDARIQLIDFGSAAPLLPPGPDGSQKLPRKHCLVPCGTCDYISPEILQAHEEALVALEMEDEDDVVKETNQDPEGYGVETDWWSLGAMLYELAYGVAPFFANEIRHTYQRILNHEKSLRFDYGVSPQLQDLLQRLLTHAEKRLGRRSILEITDHPFFDGTNWSDLSTEQAPPDIHLPQFTYADPPPQATAASSVAAEEKSEAYSQGFAFSAFFQSSLGTSQSISFLRGSVTPKAASPRDDPSSAFIGFSWGPLIDAFPDHPTGRDRTPSPFRAPTPVLSHLTPGLTASNHLTTPNRFSSAQFTTPVRPYALAHPGDTMNTIRRTSTLRRTGGKRDVSDREAMKQLVDCIGMSARKKVLESGRKPKILTSYNLTGRKRSGSYSLINGTAHRKPASGPSTNGTVRKELRFVPVATPIPTLDGDDDSTESEEEEQPRTSRISPLILGNTNSTTLTSTSTTTMTSLSRATAEDPDTSDLDDGTSGARYANYPYQYSSSECSDGPPSPSPSPRPGSAMGSVSRSRRSGTPSITTTMSALSSNFSRMRSGSGSNFSGTGMLGVPSSLSASSPWEHEREQMQRVSSAPTVSAAALKHRRPLSREFHAPSIPIAEASTVNRPPLEPLQRQRSFEYHGTANDSDSGLDDQQACQTHATLTSPLWDDLEGRHERMMYDIRTLEHRLEAVSHIVMAHGG